MSDNFVPNAKKHLIISMVKSALRIIAGALLIATPIPLLQLTGVLFVAAEVLGIVEELV